MAKAGLQFQPKDEWYTPKEIVDYFGPFDYDPATTDAQAHRLGIPNYDTVESDGLSADWTRFNRIWCNPPFTRKFEFLEKAIQSGKRVFFLMPIDSLPTRAFHKAMGVITRYIYRMVALSSKMVQSATHRQRLAVSL